MKISIEHYEITTSIERDDDNCDAENMAYMLVTAMIATGFTRESTCEALEKEIEIKKRENYIRGQND